MTQGTSEEEYPLVKRVQGRSGDETARPVVVHAVRNLVPEERHPFLRTQRHPQRQSDPKHGHSAPSDDPVGCIELLIDDNAVDRLTAQLSRNVVDEAMESRKVLAA